MAAADFVAPAGVGAAVQGKGADPGVAPNRVPVQCESGKPGAVVVDAAEGGKAVVVVARLLRPASAVIQGLRRAGDSLATAGVRLGKRTEGVHQQHC